MHQLDSFFQHTDRCLFWPFSPFSFLSRMMCLQLAGQGKERAWGLVLRNLEVWVWKWTCHSIVMEHWIYSLARLFFAGFPTKGWFCKWVLCQTLSPLSKKVMTACLLCIWPADVSSWWLVRTCLQKEPRTFAGIIRALVRDEGRRLEELEEQDRRKLRWKDVILVPDEDPVVTNVAPSHRPC